METAIRWSQSATRERQIFLLVDVSGKSFRLCQIQRWNKHEIKYDIVSTHSKVPSFRAFDWSPTNEALVAVGQSSGEVTVLRIDDGSQDHLSYSLRTQRLCNAVAFNNQNLLAVGLDKVRNDFCLHIWDVQQRLPVTITKGLGSSKQQSEPLHKLASSEPITSIKFFQNDPNLLVAGVKGQFIRLYDLREPSPGVSLQLATRCVHNIAIDYADENYFASCYPVNDPSICVWDRRVGRLQQSTSSSNVSTKPPDVALSQPSLELRNTIDSPGTIWSLRFSRTQRGCLGTLSSTGHFRTYRLDHEHVSERDLMGHSQTSGRDQGRYHNQNLYLDRVDDVQRAYHHPTEGRKESRRIVSFDFITSTQADGHAAALTLTGDGKIKAIQVPSPPEPACFSSLGYFWKGQIEAVPAASLKLVVEDEKSLLANERTHLSNVERHQRANDMGSLKQGRPIADLLTHLSQQRIRCHSGYLFDAAKNEALVPDSVWLQEFWRWVGRAELIAESGGMIQDNLDMAYLGVHAIWMDEIEIMPSKTRSLGSGSPNISKAIEALARRLDIPAGREGRPSAYKDHRRLCLHISGLALTHAEYESHLKDLTENGQHVRAAFEALVHDERTLALRILRHPNAPQSHRMLAMAIAGAAKRGLLISSEDNESAEEWSATIESLSEGLIDPYTRAILAYVRTGKHESIVEEHSLPLLDRLHVALRWLPDHTLTQYISATTRLCITTGDISGVLLSGLGTLSTVSLLSTYVRRTGDLQTAILALSFTIPRYLGDAATLRLFESWRETYRLQIMSWGLKFERVRFDIGSQKLAVDHSGRKLLPQPKPQIALVCTYCNQGLQQFDQPDGDGQVKAHRTQRNVLSGDKAAAIGTVCPNCGRHLPRCGVCDLWLGVPDASHMRWYGQGNGSVDLAASVSGSVKTMIGPGEGLKKASPAIAAKDADEDKTPSYEELMAKFTVFCVKCSHGFHAVHAKQWFQGYNGREGHKVCPVSTCQCLCTP